jgi:hypothetical protein
MRSVKRADIDWTSDEPVRVVDTLSLVEFIRPAAYLGLMFLAPLAKDWGLDNPLLQKIRVAHELPRRKKR